MLTSFQFHQLAAAAWFGAPAIVQVNASTCQLVGGAVRPAYTVYYTLSLPGGAMFSTATQFEPSPFVAVLQAIDAAWERGHLTGLQVEKAQMVVAAAEAIFCGLPTPPAGAPAPAPCSTCGEKPDYFGECACVYVPTTHYLSRAA